MPKPLLVAGLGLALSVGAAVLALGHKNSVEERPDTPQATHLAAPTECGRDYWNPEETAA
ncbi:hypothetical protein [Amycolatopsis sp. NPDC004625]|uniref:hypothetical protein n=1 Tax=Amycolatopsis sp. NPDC004625 TaxID=3154670 RepID=UPI0033BA8B63